MAHGHKPDKPPLQGDFGPVFTSKPKTSKNSAPKVAAKKSTVKFGHAPKGVGGSKKA